ncbi:MAG TPA: glycosyltransferase N-terminal domain-containing protein [Stellaceae bacterium]|nr:glycosyltransferase N-terminal domain-containing protein [Stellaceae bacterium]
MSLIPVYRGLTVALGPAVRLYLGHRLRQGKEDALRFPEREGFPSRVRPPGPLLWIHAASIGEAISTLALIDRLAGERPALNMLVTTGTVTSARLLATRLPTGHAWHQYVPVDRPVYVRRFLAHWKPGLALWIESELWPNLIVETRRRGIPLLLVNGRMSKASFRRWSRVPSLIRPLLQGFDLCLTQDATQAERFARLGAPRALTVGDLKSAAAPLPVDAVAFGALEAAVGQRPCWLAASTHAGEEAMAAEAHARLRQRFPDLLTLIAPRHPSRGDEIVEVLKRRGFRLSRRSLNESIGAGTDIYLADTLGELGLFYRIAGIAFIGGSMGGIGGHNPLEAALLDCAILHGPDMTNAAALAEALRAAGASEVVSDTASLTRALESLLADPSARKRRAAAAATVAARQRHVLDAVLERLAPWLDRLEPDAALSA